MTNYADPSALKTAPLGPCRCPRDPKPHPDGDTVTVVRKFGYGELGKVRQAARTHGREASYQVAALLGVKAWTLVMPDGSPRRIDAEQVARLDEVTMVGREGPKGELLVPGIMHALDEAFEPEDPLPNTSSAPSPAGQSESAGPTPTPPEQPASTST